MRWQAAIRIRISVDSERLLNRRATLDEIRGPRKRAADVILKERRKLVLVVRESPFNEIHLENMLKLARMGVVILPPVPAFYNNPQNLDDMINHIAMRVIDQFDIHLDVMNRWDGVLKRSSAETE